MQTTDARLLARKLMNEHGLTDWTFKFDRAVNRFGLCQYRFKTISLSAPLTQLNPESEVRDTLLHEIAHALVGAGHGHDAVWQAKARAIGSTGSRTHSANAPEPVYLGTCPACGTTTRRNRRPSAHKRVSCSRCCNAHNGGKWSELYLFQWVDTRRLVR